MYSHTLSWRAAMSALLLAGVFAATPGNAQVEVIAGTQGKLLPEPTFDDQPFTIAILGDRTTGLDWGLPYLQQAVDDLNRIQPDVVFSIGDMVQGYTRSFDTFDKEVEQYQSIVGKLKAPFFPLPGNHDVRSGWRNPDDRRFEARYQEAFGPLFYAVHFERATVVVLFTDEAQQSGTKLTDEQIAWARGQFEQAASRNRPLIVMMHKPAWRYRDSGWDRVHESLAQVQTRGIPTYVLAGHFHSMQREDDRDGVQYHLIGTCGGMIDQHPLGGQLQHFTMLNIAADQSVNIYHQPAGSTLPDDFVTAADQTRAFRLKTSDRAIEIKTTLDQPIGRPIHAPVTIALRNPIDVPITINGSIVNQPPRAAAVDGYSIVDRTPVDIFNPFVTDVHTPFEQVSPIEPVTLAPDESREVTVQLSCEAQDAMVRPPQFNFVATFEDEQGRTVPVHMRRRLPLRQQHALRSLGAIDMFACSWKFDVYDRFERDPEIGFSVTPTHMDVAIVVHDNVNTYVPVEDTRTRVEDPMSDAVLVRIGPSENQRLYLIEPMEAEGPTVWKVTRSHNDEPPTIEPDVRIDAQTIERTNGYGLILRIPLDLIGQPGEHVPFNVEIADNDDTYHTQWRRWSHPDVLSTIIIPRSLN